MSIFEHFISEFVQYMRIDTSPINLMKEKILDYIDVQSNLRLLFRIMKQFQSIFGFNMSPLSLIFVAFL